MQVVLASFYSAKKLRFKEVTAVVEEETPEPRLCCRFLVFIYFFFCIFSCLYLFIISVLQCLQIVTDPVVHSLEPEG